MLCVAWSSRADPFFINEGHRSILSKFWANELWKWSSIWSTGMGRTKRKLSLQCDGSSATDGGLQGRVTRMASDGLVIISLVCGEHCQAPLSCCVLRPFTPEHEYRLLSFGQQALVRFTLVGRISVSPIHTDLLLLCVRDIACRMSCVSSESMTFFKCVP